MKTPTFCLCRTADTCWPKPRLNCCCVCSAIKIMCVRIVKISYTPVLIWPPSFGWAIIKTAILLRNWQRRLLGLKDLACCARMLIIWDKPLCMALKAQKMAVNITPYLERRHFLVSLAFFLGGTLISCCKMGFII